MATVNSYMCCAVKWKIRAPFLPKKVLAIQIHCSPLGIKNPRKKSEPRTKNDSFNIRNINTPNLYLNINLKTLLKLGSMFAIILFRCISRPFAIHIVNPGSRAAIIRKEPQWFGLSELLAVSPKILKVYKFDASPISANKRLKWKKTCHETVY